MSLASRITQVVTAVGADIKAHAAAIAAKVNKAGDTVTGKLAVYHLSQKANMIATQSFDDVAGMVNLDIGNCSFFDISTTGNVTITVSNAPTLTDETLLFKVRVTAGAATTIDYFTTIVWLTADEIAPDVLDVNKILELEFTTTNGTLFYGTVRART